MKKLNIVMIMLITSFVFMACEKENIDNNTSTNNENNKQSSIQNEMEMSDLEVNINNFLDKMEAEEEGSLPLDSAVYYLEAGFNYRYANSGRDTELVTTQVDTSYVDIQINEDDLCTYSSMNESYYDIYEEMELIFDDIPFDDKSLNIVDVELIQEATGFQLRLISFWKFNSSIASGLPGDWVWGLDGGKCNGTYQGVYDATDAIERRYDLQKATILPYGIWHNIDMTPFYYANSNLMTQNAPSNPFGYGQSLLFWHSKTPSSTVCLLHNETDFYVDNVPEVINRIKNAQGINVTVQNIDIESSISVNNSPYLILHAARLTYGRFESQRVMLGSDDFISI